MGENNVHIILADDDADDRLVFYEAIKKASPDTELSTATNGIELMEMLNELHISTPCLIFLDLNMPVKTGLDCLLHIRSNPALKHMPVIIYSTSTSDDDIEKAYTGGADFYVPKPASFNELILLIKHVVESKQHEHKQAGRNAFVLNTTRLAQ